MDDKTPNAASPEVDMEQKYALVPADFPRPLHMGSVSGFQPKLLGTMYNGKIYATGCTPPELYRRWDACEDLAKQFVEKCKQSKAGKRAHMSEIEILDQYLPRLIETRWTSEAEAKWVIRRTAELLSWPVPYAAKA